MVPSKTGRNRVELVGFQCASVGPRNVTVELFSDAAQIEFSEGAIRCSTILKARIIKSDDDQVQNFFNQNSISFPSSSQLWARPLHIEIPGEFTICVTKRKPRGFSMSFEL